MAATSPEAPSPHQRHSHTWAQSTPACQSQSWAGKPPLRLTGAAVAVKGTGRMTGIGERCWGESPSHLCLGGLISGGMHAIICILGAAIASPTSNKPPPHTQAHIGPHPKGHKDTLIIPPAFFVSSPSQGRSRHCFQRPTTAPWEPSHLSPASDLCSKLFAECPHKWAS